MSSALAIVKPPALAATQDLTLVDAIMGSFCSKTALSYSSDYTDFAAFLGVQSLGDALASLIGRGQGEANRTALAYMIALERRELAPATISRRIAALKTAVRVARTLGLVAWSLDVPVTKAEAYRDTRGPGDDGWKAMLSTLTKEANPGTPQAVRDLALVRLLHDLALRRGEAVSLDLADVELKEGTVAVVGKGRKQPVILTLTKACCDALRVWIGVRGSEPGPLFIRLDRAASEPTRLSGESVRQLVQALGQRAGLSRAVRPHGLRHQAITAALDATNGDVRSVQQFSRHADLRTLIRYDDRRVDVAGSIARMISGG